MNHVHRTLTAFYFGSRFGKKSIFRTARVGIVAALLLTLPNLATAALHDPGTNAFVQLPFAGLSDIDAGSSFASASVDGPSTGSGRASASHNGPVRVFAQSRLTTDVTVGDWVESSASQATIFSLGTGILGPGVLVDLQLNMSITGVMGPGSATSGSASFSTRLELRRDGFAGTTALFVGEKALGSFPAQTGFIAGDFTGAPTVIGGLLVSAPRTFSFQAFTGSQLSIFQSLFAQAITSGLVDFSNTGTFDLSVVTPGVELTVVPPAVVPLPPAIFLFMGALSGIAVFRHRRSARR